MARRFFGVLAALALACGTMIAFVGTASAQPAETTLEITVHKEINGTPPGDQTFAIQLVCSDENGDHVFVRTNTISWDVDDHSFTPSDANTVFDVASSVPTDELSCTVTESDTAGATSHTIDCNVDTGTAECSGDTVTIPSGDSGEADFTLTNNYAEFPPPPAPPVVVTPAPAPAVAAVVIVASGRFTG